METLVKIIITSLILLLIYFQVVFVRSVWRSQIDPVATIGRMWDRLKPTADVIATRDPMKIYQNGQVAGDVSGKVTESENEVRFERLMNTGDLQQDQAFEYRRLRLRIVSVESISGMYMGGGITGTNVLGNVLCEKLAN